MTGFNNRDRMFGIPSYPREYVVRKISRNMIAQLLTAIYFMIALSPLASPAMHSKVVAHAISGECSGDCSICGCSVERSANHTCCCWQKRRMQHPELHQEQVADGRPTGHDHGNQVDHEAQLPDCCKKKQSTGTTVLSCGCPCGGVKIDVTGSFNSEQLPYCFTAMFIPPRNHPEYHESLRIPLSRSVDPPDPPPRLTRLS